MSRETLRGDDVIYHETFDARARIVSAGNGEADLEWLSGELEGRTWPDASLSALNRGIGETIEIVERADPPSTEEAGEETDGDDDAVPDDDGWIDRTIPCPQCNQFTQSGHDADGDPYAECSRCGWTADVDYLVENDFYAAE